MGRDQPRQLIQPKQQQPDPVRIPAPTDPDIVAGRKLATAEEFMKRRGRESTKLAPTGDTAYSRTLLGG